MRKKFPVIDIARTGQNIKHIMKINGMTVRDLQEFLKLSTPQSIYHWFDGRNMPTIDNLYALSELFRLPVDALIKGNRNYLYRSAEDSRYQRIMAYYNGFLQLQAG